MKFSYALIGSKAVSPVLGKAHPLTDCTCRRRAEYDRKEKIFAASMGSPGPTQKADPVLKPNNL